MADPPLPPEIERLIFELALQAQIQDAANLFLVAHHVHEWLLPKAFEVVLVYNQRHFPTQFTTEKFRRYGKFIRHLCLAERQLAMYDEDDPSVCPDGIISYCLSFCPNLLTLAAWWGALDSRLDANHLSQLPLTCVSIDPRTLFQELAVPISSLLTSRPPLSRIPKEIRIEPLFSRITHFEILNEQTSIFSTQGQDQRLAFVLHFPNVTHVALYRWRGIEAEGVSFFLENCPMLKALILWKHGSLELDNEGASAVPAAVKGDERIVVMRCLRVDDWEKGVRGTGFDMWSFADMVLDERRLTGWKGPVEASSQDPEDSASSE
ncbi:hypothetical protein BDN72DRAFT_963231 [Pluteus cervinus]|uniref:Uncharacterized protein n=2 Tax=Pluteus cervinus TaxID=181527 RepID=A0ACD3A630_9AGAR|nr:hypothetical protein BDN72DRAFT_965332 [Pluteus cervinus]TFK64379.1 hypothetical protein BDN72DRAFT_963231 [Pluteus cervinus]